MSILQTLMKIMNNVSNHMPVSYKQRLSYFLFSKRVNILRDFYN